MTKTPHKSGSIKPSIAEALERGEIGDLPYVSEEKIERTPYVPPRPGPASDAEPALFGGSYAPLMAAVSHLRPDPASDARGMDFGDAIRCLKLGRRVQRAGWNGKGTWLLLIVANHWETTRFTELLDGAPWVGMKTADGKFVPWTCSQTDMLADDWSVVG